MMLVNQPRFLLALQLHPHPDPHFFFKSYDINRYWTATLLPLFELFYMKIGLIYQICWLFICQDNRIFGDSLHTFPQALIVCFVVLNIKLKHYTQTSENKLSSARTWSVNIIRLSLYIQSAPRNAKNDSIRSFPFM